jgi:hypothetical protein
VEDLRALERGLDGCDQLVALSGADDDGDVPLRRDAPVAEERRKRGDRSTPDLDRERRGHHAG